MMSLLSSELGAWAKCIERTFPVQKPQYAVSADGRFLITVPVDDATSASMTLVQNWMPAR